MTHKVMSNTSHTQQHIEDFLKEAATGVPGLSMRRHALRLALVKRVCHQPSPYSRFARLLVPVLMVFMIFFFGQPTPADPQVAAVLAQSNQAIKMLSKEDRLFITNTLGADPVALLRMVSRSPDASVVTLRAPDTFAVEATTFAASGAPVPAPARMMKGGAPEQSLTAPYEVADVAASSVTSLRSVSNTPTITIQFTTPEGALVEIIFDERFVPISQTIIPL